MHRILETVDKIVTGSRQATYGHPLDNHTRTAEMWSAYLGIKITAEQVCDLNALQKISRAAHKTMTHYEDNEIDAIGFIINKFLIKEAREQRRKAAVEPPPPPSPKKEKPAPLQLVGMEDIMPPQPPRKLHWEP